MQFDETGKASFDHIYTQPDPRAYFGTLRGLDYQIPQLAKPYFAALIEECRTVRGIAVPQVLDIGSSYGINAALLRCDTTMGELYERYGDAEALSSAELVASDAELVRSRTGRTRARFIGLDVSEPALSYATRAGFLDGAVLADLETGAPTGEQRVQLGASDLIVSTGCLGYVGANTIGKVLAACGERAPWMAHFVLRMFPFSSIAASVADFGYETVKVDGAFRQRRFISTDEQSQVLDTLADVGIDPSGLEATGWFYAQLYVSRPPHRPAPAVFDLASNTAVGSRTPRQQPPTNDVEGGKVNSSQQWSPRTFGNEDLLPRVPLPSIEESCARFLTWCAPLLTEDELATTTTAVEEFLRPESKARTLQAALARYDAQDGVRSWLDLFWPSRYLGRRDRIALNANFFFLFRDTDESQLDRAAGLIAGAVDYKTRLDAETVPPIIQRGQPQSMEQNKYLFSATRIPGAEQDTVRVPYSAEWPGPSTARHIVVFFRGNAFRLDVIAPDGRPHSLDDLVDGLRAVMKAGTSGAEVDSSVGHLTTKARAEWAASRQQLLAADPANADALDTIETALFCLALEDVSPADTLATCDQLLHGNSGNRWFDKALSLIVFADGHAGINIEHCGLDGTTILSFVDFVLGTPAAAHAAAAGAVSQGQPAVDAVEFVLTAELRADALAAATSFADYAANTATTTVAFDDFGATAAKELRMSPDGFVQMAYQLAHYRAKGLIGATYESIATRQYQGGRTEAMRVVTPEVLRFVAAMDDPTADRAQRVAALRSAADKHVERAKECQAGDAPEQHLWELQWIQRRQGGELGATEPLALYDSPGWRIMRDDYLSTSSAPSNLIQFFGFGSTSAQCIGIAYVLLPERFNIYLSTPLAAAPAMHTFATKLTEAVHELRELLA